MAGVPRVAELGFGVAAARGTDKRDRGAGGGGLRSVEKRPYVEGTRIDRHARYRCLAVPVS